MIRILAIVLVSLLTMVPLGAQDYSKFFRQFAENHVVVLEMDDTYYCAGTVVGLNRVLTAAHCLEADDGGYAKNIIVDRKEKAEVLGANDWVDLALLKVNTVNKKPIKFGDSIPEMGTKVFGFGYPNYSYDPEATAMHVLAFDKGYIKVTWGLQKGYSGGPLVNENKELVGISVLIGRNSNTGYAVPVTIVKPFMELLEAGFYTYAQ